MVLPTAVLFDQSGIHKEPYGFDLFAVPGTWIPAIPAGMTGWGLNDYTCTSGGRAKAVHC